MHPRTRAQLLALAVGGVVFVLACACSSTFLNVVTLLLGLQGPQSPDLARSAATLVAGGGGILAGIVVAAVVGGLLYRRLLPQR
jgi:hypothetical protein